MDVSRSNVNLFESEELNIFTLSFRFNKERFIRYKR